MKEKPYFCIYIRKINMRKLYFTLCLSAVALLFSCGNEKQQEAPTPAEKPEQEERVDTLAMLVMQVQKCSRLYTTEYRVHKIVTHDDQLALKGKLFSKDYNINLPLGKRKVAIPIDATMKAYIDFADFSAVNVRRTPTHIELILPDPHIVLTSSRINHDDVKEYVALMRRDFSDEELASYELQGREAIIKDIAKSNIIEQARIGATNALVPMLRQLGFDEPNIIISFRKSFTPQEVEQLVDASTIEKKNGGANR